MEEEYTNKSKAIRAYCIWCMGDCIPEVRKCTSTNCPLYRFRMGKEITDAPGTRMNRRSSIKARCLDCCGGIRSEVKSCNFTNCPLHEYRI